MPLPGSRVPVDGFERLNRNHPVMMLPVRIETVFTGSPDPIKLRVRVYPDQIHINDHDPRITPDEKAAGQKFWKLMKQAGRNEVAQAAAQDWMISILPERRAAYVAQATQDGADPKPYARANTRPAGAICLPKFWRVTGFRRGANGELSQVFSKDGAMIPQRLCMDVLHGNTSDTNAPAKRNASWLHDYATATRFGMAVDIALSGMDWIKEEGIALLMVYGVGARASRAEADKLNRLFTAHRFGTGLAFQAQGVPTNSVDETRSGLKPHGASYDGTFDTVINEGIAPLGALSNGLRMSRVLGLGPNSALLPLAGAERDEDSGQGQMNEALWPVTWGEYFETLLADLKGTARIPKGVTDYVREAFLTDVRAAGPLPAIRVGAQPYGVLPVRAHKVPQAWANAEPWYELMLIKLREIWLEATPSVPKLSPGGAQSRDEALAEVVSVLGAQPHPARFLIRRLQDWRTESHGSTGLDLLALFGLVFLAGDDPVFGYDSRSIMGQWGWGRELLGDSQFGAGIPATEIRALDKRTLNSASAQIDALNNLRGRLRQLVPSKTKRTAARAWIDYMIQQVEAHAKRLDPLIGLANLPLGIKGMLRNGALDPQIAFHLYDTSPREFTRALVAGDPEGDLIVDADQQARLYLLGAAVQLPQDTRSFTPPSAGVISRPLGSNSPAPAWTGVVQRRAPLSTGARQAAATSAPYKTVSQPRPSADGIGSALTLDLPGDMPLLKQLVDKAISKVPNGRRSSYRAALNGLAELPVATLEWHLRETLGLASYRLDAWLTSLATRRLRETETTSLKAQYGGYGFVLDLKPDLGAPESNGYHHAPSLQQAVTSGILRSAWLNHGSEGATSPLSVNLTSARLRKADRLIQAVSQGRTLGDILGQDFERKLHDIGLDRLLDPLRAAVLVASGDRPRPSGPLDGLKLLEAYDAGQLKAELKKTGPAVVRNSVRAAIEDVRAVFDALGDAGIAEATHYIAMGNTARAAAILDAISLGETPPSELRHARTDISKSELTHHVIAALPEPEGLRQQGLSGKASTHPALNEYVARLLQNNSGLSLQVVSGNDIYQVRLEDLGLAPLDLVMEAARPGALGQRAIGYLYGKGELLTPGAYAISSLNKSGGALLDPDLEDFEELCVALAAHIGALRPLMPADLGVVEADSDSFVDSIDLKAQIDLQLQVLEAHLFTLKKAAQKKDLRRLVPELLEASLLGLPETLPGSDLLFSPDHSRLQTFVAFAIELVETRYQKCRKAVTTAKTLGDLIKVSRMICGNTLCPELVISRVSVPFGSARGFDLPRRGDIIDWAGKYAHVRDDMRIFTRAWDTAELMADTPLWPFDLAQRSSRKHKAWLGLHLPEDGTPGGKSWLAIDGGGVAAMRHGERFTAYLVDSWTERLPDRETTTAVSFHFDAPSSKPPQSILQAVTPDRETGWSDALLRKTLIETIENAQLRAVTGQELDRFGHHLPAIFVPGGLDAGPQPPSETEGAS